MELASKVALQTDRWKDLHFLIKCSTRHINELQPYSSSVVACINNTIRLHSKLLDIINY